MYTVLCPALFTQHYIRSFFTFQTIPSESSFQAALVSSLCTGKGRTEVSPELHWAGAPDLCDLTAQCWAPRVLSILS